MRNVLIFHGTGGYPGENWLPWLKKELEKLGCKVYVPQFPTPEGQSLRSWLEVLKDYKQYINEQSILIGHSLGGLFLLRVLERLKHSVRATFFVGASIGVKPIRFYEADKKFSGFSFDWDKIKENAGVAAVYHSDNDPYVSIGNGEKLAKKLGIELTLVPKAGHFNTAAGYISFSDLLENIKQFV